MPLTVHFAQLAALGTQKLREPYASSLMPYSGAEGALAVKQMHSESHSYSTEAAHGVSCL